jgi:MoaA/NifB/PqqE/SkfB family radical SAM enzyme
MTSEGSLINQRTVSAREHVWKAPFYIIRGLKFHAAGHVYTPKPLYCTLNMTHRCNSRCIMCLYWRQQSYENELTIDEIGKMFRNPLFSSLEKLVLSGGEPTLREDLVDIARVVLDCCPWIKEVSLISNGLEPDLVTGKVRELLELINSRENIKFAVSISLDGYGEIHEEIRRVPQAFERVSETLNRLKEMRDRMPFYLCSTSVVQPVNIGNIPGLIEYAQTINLPIAFSP